MDSNQRDLLCPTQRKGQVRVKIMQGKFPLRCLQCYGERTTNSGTTNTGTGTVLIRVLHTGVRTHVMHESRRRPVQVPAKVRGNYGSEIVQARYSNQGKAEGPESTGISPQKERTDSPFTLSVQIMNRMLDLIQQTNSKSGFYHNCS